jgi:hypothetical protein
VEAYQDAVRLVKTHTAREEIYHLLMMQTAALEAEQPVPRGSAVRFNESTRQYSRNWLACA